MIIFTQYARGAQPARSGNAGHNANGQPFGIKARPLFDMHFQEGRGIVGAKQMFTARHRIGIKAFFAHMVGQTPAAIGALHLKDFRCQQTKRGLAARIGSWEPLPGFLSANGHHRHVAGGLEASALHAGHRRQPRQNPGGAIEIPALAHRIKVAAHDDPLGRAVRPGQGHV